MTIDKKLFNLKMKKYDYRNVDVFDNIVWKTSHRLWFLECEDSKTLESLGYVAISKIEIFPQEYWERLMEDESNLNLEEIKELYKFGLDYFKKNQM